MARQIALEALEEVGLADRKDYYPSQLSVGQQLKERLTKAAGALRELYDSMGRAPRSSEENPAIIFDRAAERVCRGCALCGLCWQNRRSEYRLRR